MSMRVETETFIRFQLDQLGAQNRHHEFENICFRIAQRRISSNILPATGPVSSGGDQGRDGETFFSALPEELPRAGGFVGRATTEPLVLACTIQRADLTSKVKSDIEKITSQGKPVARVAYFMAQNMPVGPRHDLQEYARQNHSIELEIFDAMAISNLLAEPDLVWVAEKMLDLPSNLVPTAETHFPEWYQDLLQRIRDSDEPLVSPGDLAAVRAGLRHATQDPDAQNDLAEWLQYTRSFISSDLHNYISEDVQMKARYEVVVASLRGLGTLSNVEEYIDEFINYTISGSASSDLVDASSLLAYWMGAWTRGIASTTSEHLMNQIQRLLDRIDTLLAETDREIYPNAAAHFLAARSHVLFHPDVTGMQRNPHHQPPKSDPVDMTFEEIIAQVGSAEELHIRTGPLMTTLADLAELLPLARTFPVQTICNLFEAFSPVLTAHENYDKVRNALDEAIGLVEGENAIAERCRSRALNLMKAEKPLLALREFHKAKTNWFHGDTLRGSVLAMLTISEIYANLNLPNAAKGYALAAGAIAVSSSNEDVIDLVSDSLLQTTKCCYTAGAWLDATAFGQLAIRAHGIYAEQAFDYDQHPEIIGLDFHQSIIYIAAKRFRPQLISTLANLLSPTEYDKRILPLVKQAETSFTFDEKGFAKNSIEQLGAHPFSDTGPKRVLSFSALGTHWKIISPNNKATVLAAERFAATAQILLAELATEDPVLLEETVLVEVQLAGSAYKERVEFAPDNNQMKALVTLLPYTDKIEAKVLEHEILEAVGVLLMRLSVLSQEQILEMLDIAFARGFLNQISFGRPYDEIAGLLDEAHYIKAVEVGSQIIGTVDYDPPANPALEQPSFYGPGFSEVEWKKMIEERYEVSDLLKFTLARIRRNPMCRKILLELRDEGWLDWHLLLAIYNVATNYRIRQQVGSGASPEMYRSASHKLIKRAETAETPNIPLHNFSRDELHLAFQLATFTIAKRIGLHIDRETPNFGGVRRLLDRRFGFLQDVPHPDFLADLR